MSMRSLAGALGIGPSAIYYDFSTEEAVIRAAVALVFDEAMQEFLEHSAELLDGGDPVDLLVRSAVLTRRAFARHSRIAPYLATSPEASFTLASLLAVFGAALEQLGLTGERAGQASFAYGSYVYGSILVSSSRRVADERVRAPSVPLVSGGVPERLAIEVSPPTVEAIDRALDVSGSATTTRSACSRPDSRCSSPACGSGPARNVLRRRRAESRAGARWVVAGDLRSRCRSDRRGRSRPARRSQR